MIQKFFLVTLFFGACFGQALVDSLNNLDFSNVIAGPLMAAVDAQARSAASSVDFIRNVAFRNVSGQSVVNNLEFSYDSVAADGTTEKLKMSIPLITMVHIPYLEISNVDIQFNVKLNGIKTIESDSSSGADVQGSFFGQYRSGFSGMSVEVKSQEKTKIYGEDKQEYSYTVQVRAIQASPPPGAQKLSLLLERLTREDVPVTP